MTMGKSLSRTVGVAGRPQGHLGFEATLWATADKLRGNLDAAEYKHVVLGLIFQNFLSEFASTEGKKGGQFYTPRCVVQLLVEMLAPYKGRVFAPCCASGGMFLQTVEFVKAHANGNGNPPPPGLLRAGGGKAKGDISIFGQPRGT